MQTTRVSNADVRGVGIVTAQPVELLVEGDDSQAGFSARHGGGRMRGGGDGEVPGRGQARISNLHSLGDMLSDRGYVSALSSPVSSLWHRSILQFVNLNVTGA